MIVLITIEILVPYNGICESCFLELHESSNAQQDNETLPFELCNKYETPCMVYFENEDLELVSLPDTCTRLQKIVLSSHYVCMTCNETLSFGMRNEYETPLVYFVDEDLELSSLHDICMTFHKTILSSHDLHTTCDETMSFDKYETSLVYFENKNLNLSSPYDVCAICKCSPRWDVTCYGIYYEDLFLETILLLYNKCMACKYSQVWGRTSRAVYCENMLFELNLSPEKKLMICNHSPQWFKTCKIRNKRPMHQCFYHFRTCSTFSITFDCKNLEHLFRRNLVRKRDYVAYRLEQCSIYISAFIIYGYCMLTGRRKVENAKKKKKDEKKPLIANECIERGNNLKGSFYAGGRHQTTVNGEIVCEYLQTCTDTELLNNIEYFKGKCFHFEGYKLLSSTSKNSIELSVPLYFSRIPLDKLTTYLNMKELQDMSDIHNISMPRRIEKKTMLTYFQNHHCTQCDLYVSVFTEKIKIKRDRSKKKKEIKTEIFDVPSKFPPDPPSNALIQSIIQGFCKDTAPENFIEGGCAVCGKLSPINEMVLLNEIKFDLKVISPGDVGQYERLHESDPLMSLRGPILAEDCHHVCQTCRRFLKKDKMPPESLANFFWIGPIPSVLKNLTFAEKMLISRIRHNKCLVRVSSGRAKMTANVIMFSNPTVKVYHALPPSRREISEILAFVFQGPIQPTDSDVKRTPMLVRRNVVKDALEWLKLNHVDYEDLYISLDNLNDYPLSGVPVNIEYSKSDPDSGNKIASAMSVYDDEFEDGTTDGPCPFTVHGLTGPEFENMSMDRLKAKALQHLIEKGSTLGISHDSKPQSMYDNPQAYPQMFPWLFPYGSGGIGQKCHFAKISEATQKFNLLMYHDKRFQTDFYFPMIAFNHEQLKASVSGSFLLAKRKKWPDISNRLKSLNRDVLKNISDKLSNGVRFSPTSIEEKNCYHLLNDLDHVGGFVKGSITSKKHMRNEIWSMISQLGAPSWFITLSPADSRHPICLYYADKDIEFRPELRSANERNLLVAQNPVAASRFFDFMVRMFIKHVLGIGTDHSGLYGDTAGYYGVVEQQGRLTLHLHVVLWIKNVLSPQEIRDKLMNNDGEFQKNLIQYLEGCQKGEFLTGSMEYVKSKIPIDIENRSKGIHTIFNKTSPQTVDNSYQDPTLTLPEEPPNLCELNEHTSFDARQLLSHWWSKFYNTVDDILLRSNVHRCNSSDQEKNKFKAKGCLNRDGICKARFPRPIVPETTVNFEDGYINLKKLESMLNTISPCITYIFRCNTDVTSLLSGTSIKAVISYVSDYIAKPTLKTYQIFATAYNVFDKNANLEPDDNSRTDDARKLILKIVNALSSKMEIGSPMASMYLLQNPDHYTSHKFIPFWWRSFVNDVTNSETSNGSTSQNHDIDIKMEDAFQEEEKNFLPLTKDKKTDDCGIDVLMEDVSKKKIEISRCSINNDDLGREIYFDVSKLDSEASFLNNKAMDIDGPNNLSNAGIDTIKNLISTEEENFHIDIEGNNQDKCEAKYDSDDEDGDEDDTTDEKLLISQDGNEYVASSKVDDYKYRPEVYNSSSLYDWSKLSVKVKVPRNKKDDAYFKFLPGHAQSNSHMVKLVSSRDDTFVLNFIGGPLPRCDQGDFDFYCRTMLTLFKPWRNSCDLKNKNQTWVEAFTSYEFKDANRKVMNNFNLRYECLDERDDYHAILKRQCRLRKEKDSFLFRDQYDNDCNLGINTNFEEEYGNQELLGPNAIRKAQQMIETDLLLNKVGWLDDEKKTNSNMNIQEFRPPVNKTGLQWKNIVKQCRESLLKSKKIHLSPVENALQSVRKYFVEPSDVKLLSAEYFMHDFQAENSKDREIILKTIFDFSLNEEQKRAFHIVGNHASETCPDQLKMHLGGMGGTGKTQVIKALISMFDQRQENHRFIVLAPTGTAAALLNGSTYHSILGIRSSYNSGEEESIKNENSIIKEVQERLEGVDYIFIDEISMIACHELYAISSQLSKVTNEHNKPFGGKNIILAGDFAQLPPTSGFPLYSNIVSKDQKNCISKRDQESTIGKILWHQMTTVVILTQNMRQTEMSEDDKNFRTALSNMRYASCTRDDLEFLETLRVDSDKLRSDPNFKNESIITSLNTQKDQINESCSIRFAQETGQQLTHFYSIDKLGNVGLERKKRGSRASKKISANVDIPDNIQKSLWESSPHSSEHLPGKLSLCLGMPIMIRNNDATELCITKGQEAYVVGWDAMDGPKDQNVLETLYLELKNPPKTIQLPHLPRNVIPMTRMSKKIKCSLPNDHEINIIRQQINVLPNFSMTDYGSQGKTRIKNPVNLSHCKNFQSIYTCLSRSSNAAGTLIIQGFNSIKVTKGLPGHLRQEFRELHLLDNITKEIYEGRLNKKYFGPLRNPMIYKYQNEIKSKYCNNLHRALKLFDGECIIKEKGEDGTWNMNIYENLTNLNRDENKMKRKLTDLHNVENSHKKKKLSSASSPNLNMQSPLGLTWDEKDYSCAYDSFFTVLYHIWNEGQLKHKAYFRNGTQWIRILDSKFTSLLSKNCTFKSVRDYIRSKLNHEKPLQYPYGKDYTNIDELVRDFTSSKLYVSSHLQCRNCQFRSEHEYSYLSDYTAVGWNSSERDILQNVASIQEFLDYKIIKKDEITNETCQKCRHFLRKDFPLYNTQCINELPTVLIFSVASWIDINQHLHFDVSNTRKEYILKGIIYWNGNHFTAKLVDEGLTVWYHDGQTTRSLCRKEESLMQTDDVIPLKTNGQYRAILLFYVEKMN